MSKDKKDLAIELGQKIYSNTIEGLKKELQAERDKVALLREAVEFAFDNVHHEEKCLYPNDNCFCMDRTFYNDARVYDRSLQALEKLKELKGEE